MVSLDQVKLLENKVAKTIEYVGQVIGENAALHQKEAELQAKLEAHQKRIDELEGLIARFKEDQSRIEGGILSALERLNRFEDAIEKNLNEKTAAKPGNVGPLPVSQPGPAQQQSAASQTQAAAPVKAPAKKAAPKTPVSPAPQSSSASQPVSAPLQPSSTSQPVPAPLQPSSASQPLSGGSKKGDTGGEGVFFEIAETEAEAPEDDAVDSLEGELLNGEDTAAPTDSELDIF